MTAADANDAPETDLVFVVDRTATIENILNQVIQEYFAPRKEARVFFWDVLLDSSVMTLGSKVKVAMAIAHKTGKSLNQNAIHTVMSLRNAFAHHRIGSHPTFNVGKMDDETFVYYKLQILRQSGKVESKPRHKALEEFTDAYKLAYKSLVALVKEIKATA